jgi:hypothetical protein
MTWDLRHRKSSLVIRLLPAVWIAAVVVVLCATGRWWGLVFVVPLVLDLYLFRRILTAGSGGKWCQRVPSQPRWRPPRSTQTNRRRSAMSATLKLAHKTIGLEVRRGTYDVMLDGKPAGSLELNDPIEIPVEPGHHALRVRNGRNSSRAATFDAAEGETVAFRCGGKRILPIFLLSFVVPSLALSLRSA